MKKNLEITDLKIGDKVAIKMPTLGGKKRLSCTMEVVALFKDGDVYRQSIRLVRFAQTFKLKYWQSQAY